MTTEPLTIQVPSNVAQAYRAADTEEQQKLDIIFGFQLQNAMSDTRSLQEVMRDISRKAQERGMTPETLQEESKPTKLPDWCNVYEGMTDEEIDKIERAIVRDPGTRNLAD